MILFLFQIPDESELMKLKDALDQSQIQYHLWIEEPEHLPTCIALIPYPKHEVTLCVEHYKLFK
jgi:hypothetical protein